jgi:hypothetical protein
MRNTIFILLLFFHALHCFASQPDLGENTGTQDISTSGTSVNINIKPKQSNTLIGVHLNVNYTFANITQYFNSIYPGFSANLDSLSSFGVNFDISFFHFFNDFIGFKTGIKLSYFKSKTSGSGTFLNINSFNISANYRSLSLNIPLAAAIRFSGLYLYAGPEINIGLSSKIDFCLTETTGIVPFTSYSANYNKSTYIGFVSGIGFIDVPKGKYKIRGDLTFRYEKYKNAVAKIISYSVALSASVLFGL